MVCQKGRELSVEKPVPSAVPEAIDWQIATKRGRIKALPKGQRKALSVE